MTESLGVTWIPNLEVVSENTPELLKKYELTEIDPQKWYPQGPFIQMMRDMEDNFELFSLVSIGMGIAKHAKMPPEMDSLEKALFSVDTAYRLNNRNGSEDRGWKAEKLDDNSYRMTSSTPFPSNLEYGVLYGWVERFGEKGRTYTVEITEEADKYTVFTISMDN